MGNCPDVLIQFDQLEMAGVPLLGAVFVQVATTTP
jgi:hypothetical protein